MLNNAGTNVKFSVVIPLYNKKSYIQQTLCCVLRQTYLNFEVIVVDDGSTDGSFAEAQKVLDDRIVLLRQDNQGVSVARNAGIYVAKGEYISFLDADDFWDTHYLETVHRLTEQFTQSDIFVTAYRVWMADGRTNYSLQREPEEGCLDSYWLTLGGGYDFVWTSATTVRRSTLLKAGCFRPGEQIGQDLDMWARVARINPHVAYSSKICVTYNRSAEQNARSRVKLAHAAAFLQDLQEELENPAHSAEEIAAIQNKYDLKMTAYLFTAILNGERNLASQELRRWKGAKTRKNRLMRLGLRIAIWMPKALNRWLYQIRLRVF